MKYDLNNPGDKKETLIEVKINFSNICICSILRDGEQNFADTWRTSLVVCAFIHTNGTKTMINYCN